MSRKDGSTDDYLRELSIALGGSAVDASDLVFFTVKTTLANQKTRVLSIVDTYWQFAPESFVFFTDSPPSSFESKTGNELPTIRPLDPPIQSPTRDNFSLVNTLCSATHEIDGLCCKTACEIVYYNEHSTSDWMCHLDDDTYLNYPQMVKYLSQFDPREEHYIGFSPTADGTWAVDTKRKEMMERAAKEGRPLKPSISISTKKDGDVIHKDEEKEGVVRVPYGTGGSGWCLSRPLVARGIDTFANLQVECANIAYPDDVSLGYVIQEKLGGPKMKMEPRLNSHLDAQDFASREEAMQQLTLGSGYKTEIGKVQPKSMNAEAIQTADEAAKRKVFTFASWRGKSFVDEKTGRPPDDDDPLGFRSLHCSLYPDHCSNKK